MNESSSSLSFILERESTAKEPFALSREAMIFFVVSRDKVVSASFFFSSSNSTTLMTVFATPPAQLSSLSIELEGLIIGWSASIALASSSALSTSATACSLAFFSSFNSFPTRCSSFLSFSTSCSTRVFSSFNFSTWAFACPCSRFNFSFSCRKKIFSLSNFSTSPNALVRATSISIFSTFSFSISKFPALASAFVSCNMTPSSLLLDSSFSTLFFRLLISSVNSLVSVMSLFLSSTVLVN
mmetsp:Transcript_27966/g.65753  ORF Transcript_27966/g.65753 Transcript_27966/m.65753 type:complete len:241 (-) Transcript_27966:1819-2541(-)